jgi:phosphatidylglycerophosphate synthase
MSSVTPAMSLPSTVAREVLIHALWLSAPLAALAVLVQRGGDLSPAFAGKALLLFWAGAAAIAWLARCHLKARRFGAANVITLARAGLVALLVACLGEAPIAGTVASLGVLVLLLDGVDGWLARRFGSASDFGARFDMETDALLLLVLTALTWQYGRAGPWILLAGLMRYGFVAAATVLPRLARPLPESQRRKSAYVVQAATILISLSPWVAQPASGAVAFFGLAVLALSFAIDIRWLARDADAPIGSTPA